MASSSASSTITGMGWIPVDFTQISSGAPLGNLPLDPINNGSFLYAYAATSSNLSFKLVAASMESTKYGLNGANNVVSTDGGNFPKAYEVGTNLNL